MSKRGHGLLTKAACACFAVFVAVAANAAAYDLNSMVAANMGYVLTGLGDNGSGVALVFTNHTKSATWTVPVKLDNIQFLVVGGGGGGGGAADATYNEKTYRQGGAGGGGGGVVVGQINTLSSGSVISVKVGKGGQGGVQDTDPNYTAFEPGTNAASEDGRGASESGGDSSFGVGDLTYVTAFGGGRDLGVGSTLGGVGGSCAGNRNESDVQKLPTPTRGVVDDGAADLLTGVQVYGQRGGTANTVSSPKASGGGGGASYIKTLNTDDESDSMEDGLYCVHNNSFSGGTWSNNGGRGGKGLPCDITGVSVVYGSGASGGTTSSTREEKWGENAGQGGRDAKAASSGVDCTGGGGGGGGGVGNGGNGGSGIVVFRFTLPAKPVVAQVQDLAYTGRELCGVYEGFGYTLSGRTTATEVGTYTATATLDSDYGMWADGTTDRVLTIEWRIWPASFVAANHGYTVRGLGETGEEVAVVFTNHNAGVMTWTPPRDLRSVRFLVVGGGGGGGADSSNSDNQNGGAGGGGGGVVTGIVKRLSKGDLVSVEIGKGGVGGKPGYDPESGDARGYGAVLEYSEDSLFKINDLVYVKALRGGNDIGANGPTVTQSGGSGAGNRHIDRVGGKAKDSYIIESDNVVGEFFGNDGGDRRDGYGSGGGGGALSVGGDAISDDGVYKGGDGGRGIESFITGERVVYGSGGGGGTASCDKGGQGGEGAGNGNKEHQGPGESARPNQGGGGGGAGGGIGGKCGGDGGSGIVVFRFRLRPPMFHIIVR